MQALKINTRNFYASRAFPNKHKKVLLPLSSISRELQMVPEPPEITCKLCFEKIVVARWSIHIVGKSFADKVFCSQNQ